MTDKEEFLKIFTGNITRDGADKLLENLDTLMDAVIKAKPASAKGTYIKSMVVSTTMGPGVKFNPLKF